MSSSLAISYVPGYTFAPGELATQDKLNALGSPTINIIGTIGTASLTPGSVTTTILADGALAATSTGRGKMSPGFFSADATGRAFFAAGFFGAGDLTSIDIFATGFFTADAQGRTPFAASFVEQTLINATVAPVVASSRNLICLNNVGTPNSKVDVTADEVLLKDSSSKPYLAAAVSVTADVTVSGANGLDTGAEAGTTWYYVWLIYNGTTVASLLSVSSTAPTLPSGYTFKALVGTVFNNGSSNFVSFYQQDRETFLDDTLLFTAKTGVTSWTATTGADLTALQGIVPPLAKQAWGNMGNTTDNRGMAVGGDGFGMGAQAVAGVAISGTVLSYAVAAPWRAPLKTAQTLYYIMSDTTSHYRVSVSGYKI